MNKLESLTSKELLDLFNKATGQSIKRFSDRAAGLARIQKLIAKDKVVAAKVQALLGLDSTSVLVFDTEAPLPTIAEVLEEGLEKGAKRQGVLPLRGLSPKPKQKKLTAKDAVPVEGSDNLVTIGGRVVRKENIAKIVKGESLWGAVGEPPAEKDALKGEHNKLNLNYPPKATIRPMREGTGRQKLVMLMRKKGVTPEEVAEMFNLTVAQAIYKLRDLHYVGGHGLEVRNGRVFVTDKA